MTVAVVVDRPLPWHARLAAATPGAVVTTDASSSAEVMLDLRSEGRPRPGTWAFEIGLGGLGGLDQPGVRELARGERACPVRLVQVETAGVRVLRQGVLELRGEDPASVSADVLRRLADWPRWALAAPGPVGDVVPLWDVLPPAQVSSAWIRRRRLRRRWEQVMVRERWAVGRCEGLTLADLVAGAELPDPEWAAEPPNAYLADPFACPGSAHLLVERLDLSGPSHPGTLVEVEWTPGGILLPRGEGPVSVGHLSYPSAFSHDGDTWCVPESAAEGGLALWRRGTQGWQRVRQLLDQPAVDADLWQQDGHWWLFYSLEGPDKNEELHLASAPDLQAPFLPHPLNPVVRDVSAARGGGRPFLVDGRLYRPAQDCTTSYGGGLAIVEIYRLSTEDFAQRVVRRFGPRAPYPDGLHTLNAWNGGLVLDAKRHETSWRSLGRKLARRMVPRASA